MNDVVEIIHRLRQGEPLKSIKRGTGHDRKTIRKYREIASRHGFLDSDKPLPKAAEVAEVLGSSERPQQNVSTVEPYGGIVMEYLERGLNMKLIWRKLREDHDYTGSYSSVKRYCRRLRPLDPEGFCRIETEPGEEAQVDFGLLTLTQQGAEDLYEIIRQRYENRSIVITSNRAPVEWADIFGNSLMASAALDRLTHHSHFIEMKGESYRQRQRRIRTGQNIFEEKEKETEIKTDQKSEKQTEEKGGEYYPLFDIYGTKY